MNTPKRHHYLPQFYLNGFCRDGVLSVFDREANQFRRQTPKNTGLKYHYYTVQDETGQNDTRIEALLSQIEGRAKEVLSKLSSRNEISSEEKEELSIFVAFMMGRVPKFEESVNDMQSRLIRHITELMFSDEERVESIMREREEETGEAPDVTAKDLVEFQKGGNYEILIHRNESLRLMLDIGMRMADYFRQMHWLVLHCQERTSFVTSDNPFAVAAPSNNEPSLWGVGILTRGAQKILPLSQRSCLVMLDRGDDVMHRDISQGEVRRINLFTAAHSDRFVLGRDEALVRNLVQTTQLTERERRSMFKVVGGRDMD